MIKLDQIKKYDVISFDIFDTLIYRCVNEPSEVFKIIEHEYLKQYGTVRVITDFTSKRISAERIARSEIQQEEITLDEIYARIECPEEIREIYKSIETDTELRVCVKNREVFEIYKTCIKLGKRIIIVSDMYLPQNIIEEILVNNGYSKYSEIYLSSTLRKTKATGSLYEYVLEKENIKSSKILHFGDNIQTDFKNAMKRGIHAYNIKKEKKKLYSDLQENIFSNFLEKTNNNNEDTFKSIGYSAFGPMLFGYINWIKNDLKSLNIQKAFFLSRDGYIMKQVYDIIRDKSDVEAQYMYASRRALQVAALHLNPEYKVVMSSMFIPRTVTVGWLIKKWGLEPEECVDCLKSIGINENEAFEGKEIVNNMRAERLYKCLENKIIGNSKKEYKAFIEYLKSISFSGNLAIIDIGWYGNMQNALMRIIESSDIEANITGYYLGIVPESNYQNVYRMNGYLFMLNKNEDLFWKFKYLNSLMELFFMAPHGSAKKYYLLNGEPEVELSNFEYEDTETFVSIQKVQAGALDFVSQYVGRVAKYIDAESNFYVKNMLDTFINPNLNIANLFGELEIWDEKWIKIAPKTKRTDLKMIKKNLIDAPWKMGYLKRLLVITLRYDVLINNLRKIVRYKTKKKAKDR